MNARRVIPLSGKKSSEKSTDSKSSFRHNTVNTINMRMKGEILTNNNTQVNTETVVDDWPLG
jgi:hypothetical protein